MSKKLKYSVLILIIIHVVGVFLFLYYPEAVELSHVTLILTGILLLINESNLKALIFPIVLTVIGGYIVELIGTKTGYLFGEYAYGNSLGPKLLGVPVVIGLNWLIVVRASLSLVESIFKPNKVIVALFVGALCTLLDYLIEPVAIQYDFWSWSSQAIPIFNYVCWFGFSSLFAYLFLNHSKRNNKLGIPILFVWILFFAILNIL